MLRAAHFSETPGEASPGPGWRGRLAGRWAGLRCDPARAAERLIVPVVACLAAGPFAGWPTPLAWLAVMTALAMAELWRMGREPSGAVLSWLSSVGYSIAAMYLVVAFNGAAQTFGVTLYGVTMFQILARDYARTRRLMLNLIPPVLSMALVQGGAAAARIAHGRGLEIITLLASPCIVALAFMAVQKNLTRNRREQIAATTRAAVAAREIREAHRIALLAESLAGVGHWRLDAQTRALTWSEGVRRIYGHDIAAEAPGIDGILAMHDPDNRAMVMDLIARAMQDGAPFAFESRIARPDGEVRHIAAVGAAERDANGAVATVYGATLDVTDARARESALRQSEERFRMLADHSTDIILWYALDGTILYVSPSARSLGYAPEEMVGKKAVEFMHPDDQAHVAGLISDLFTGAPLDRANRREGRFMTGDGRCIWLEGSPTLIRDVDGAPTSAVTSLRDVTARRQLEDDLMEAKARAEAAVEAKAEFLANMSHEVRTPLTAVLGFAGLLETMQALPAEARAHIRRIVASGGALLAVVNDILDFSKLEAGQVELDPQPFEARAFFEDTRAMFADQAAAKGLALNLTVDAAMPAFLAADRARVGQILGNLISNAIKFTDAGMVSVTAVFDAGEGRLHVAVADTGPGVAADKLDRLFQRFSQVDGSVSRRYGGTGLGLAISRGLAALMGGDIDVASRAGAGSTFTLWLNAAAAEQVPAEAIPARVAAGRDASAARILVVDDLDVNRMLAKAILEAAGHRVVEAAGGPEAISAALAGVFDLILMDLQMPGMDGYAAARAIRALPSENRLTPIVALSANVLPEHVNACRAAGMNDHLAKPIVPADLLAAVSRWAGARSEPAEVETAAQAA